MSFTQVSSHNLSEIFKVGQNLQDNSTPQVRHNQIFFKKDKLIITKQNSTTYHPDTPKLYLWWVELTQITLNWPKLHFKYIKLYIE